LLDACAAWLRPYAARSWPGDRVPDAGRLAGAAVDAAECTTMEHCIRPGVDGCGQTWVNPLGNWAA
jgi:hypothetical protein